MIWVHFTKKSRGNFFLQGNPFVKFFPIFKLESDFFPHFLSKITKLENSAHLFILNYNWANFQGNQRTFLVTLFTFTSLHWCKTQEPSKNLRWKFQVVVLQIFNVRTLCCSSRTKSKDIVESKAVSLAGKSIELNSIRISSLQVTTFAIPLTT